MTEEVKETETTEVVEEPTPRVIGELFCDEAGLTEDGDGLIWAPALPVGELKLSPGPGGKPIMRPLRVIEGHSPNPADAIGLDDVVDAFNEGAVQHVTIPLSHADRVEENTGFIRKVKIDDLTDPATGTKRKALWAAFDVIDPEIKKRMTDGRIANRSVGIEFDYQRKSDGKPFKSVLRHIALTNKPWVNGMPAFGGLGLSEDDQVVSLIPKDSNWNNNRGLRWREQRLETALQGLGDYVVSDLDSEEVIVAGDDGKHYVATYSFKNGQANLVDQSQWRETSWDGVVDESDDDDADSKVSPPPSDNPNEATGDRPKEGAEGSPRTIPEVKPDPNRNSADTALAEAQSERMLFINKTKETNSISSEGGVKVSGETKEIKLSEEDVATLLAERDQLRADLAERDERIRRERHVAKVDTKIDELKGLGLSEQTGLLKVIRDIYLSDNEKPATVMLSEDGEKQVLTVTEILDKVLDALPRNKDQKIALSEQHLVNDDHGRPAVDTSDEGLTPRQRADKLREELGIQTKLLASK